MERLDFLLQICDKMTMEDKTKIHLFIQKKELTYEQFKYWMLSESPSQIQPYLDIPYFTIVELGEKLYTDEHYHQFVLMEQRIIDKLK